MRRAIIFVVLVLLLVLCASPVYANGIPALPHAFYGGVTINGPALDGTQISATVDEGEVLTTSQNPVGTVNGNYGIDGLHLLVQGTIPDGAAITFYVNGVEVEGVTATFEAGGGPTEMNLSVTIPRPPAGGGPGVRDTTPPRISDISASAITETSADIAWKTNEKSTSQVEYWCNGHKKSDLDEEMVINHHIHLTDLTPGTTYYYKTMSRDAADNLAVSDEYTFTTKGKAPAAIFTSSDLAVSPSEVDIGETVTISLLVTNTGDLAGSYEVTLKIAGVVVATKEVALNAGASEEVTFTTAKDVAGSYSVGVNGLSGSFTVKEKPAPPEVVPPEEVPPVKPPINWPVVGGIIAGVIVLGLLVFFLVRRRAV